MDTESFEDSNQARFDWRRPLRYVWRVPRLLLHVFLGLPPTLLFCSQFGRRFHFRGHNLREHMIRWWSRTTCRIFGLRIAVHGIPLPDPALWVANHTTWLDIELLHSQNAVSFVAKAEIGRWPVVGYLARAGATVFHHRGSGDSQQRVNEALAMRLEQGHSVAIFPEGRTGRGDRVLPFHGRLLQAAVATGTLIQPVAIRFDVIGSGRSATAYVEGESFMSNFFRVLGGPLTTAHLFFLTPICPAGQGRRDMAHQARAQIVEALDR